MIWVHNYPGTAVLSILSAFLPIFFFANVATNRWHNCYPIIVSKKKGMAAGPLMCWDIFMDSYHQRMQRLDDWQNLKRFAQKKNWLIEWNLEEWIVKKGRVALITDPSLTIQFATSNLFEMNGYLPKEVIGKKPSLFQGEKTSIHVKAQIRTAIQQLKPFYGTLINYRKDGSVYNCEVEEYPVFTKEKKHSHFIAFEQLVPM